MCVSDYGFVMLAFNFVFSVDTGSRLFVEASYVDVQRREDVL